MNASVLSGTVHLTGAAGPIRLVSTGSLTGNLTFDSSLVSLFVNNTTGGTVSVTDDIGSMSIGGS